MNITKVQTKLVPDYTATVKELEVGVKYWFRMQHISALRNLSFRWKTRRYVVKVKAENGVVLVEKVMK